MLKKSLLAGILLTNSILSSYSVTDAAAFDIFREIKRYHCANEKVRSANSPCYNTGETSKGYKRPSRSRLADNTLLDKYNNEDNIHYSLHSHGAKAYFGSTNGYNGEINFVNIKSPRENIKNLIFENKTGDLRPEFIHLEYINPVVCEDIFTGDITKIPRVQADLDWNGRKSFRPKFRDNIPKHCTGGIASLIGEYIAVFESGYKGNGKSKTKRSKNQLK